MDAPQFVHDKRVYHYDRMIRSRELINYYEQQVYRLEQELVDMKERLLTHKLQNDYHTKEWQYWHRATHDYTCDHEYEGED